MGNIIEYNHHGIMVKVDEDLRGKQREHCLCFRCLKFSPNTGFNCVIAQQNFELCQRYGLTLPVYECAYFAEGAPDLRMMP